MQQIIVFAIILAAFAYAGWRVYIIIRSKDKGCCGCPDQANCPYCQAKSECKANSECKTDCSCCQGKSE